MGSIPEPKAHAAKHYKDWPNEGGFNATEIYGEVRKPLNLTISGQLPSYVAGSLYRTGPGAYKVPRADSPEDFFKVSHWFDGFTTTHRFNLIAGSNGNIDQVQYTSRLQVEELVEKVRNGTKLEGASFGQKRDPCESLYHKVKSFFAPNHVEQGPNMRNIGVALREPLPCEIASIPENEREGRQVMTVATDTPFTKQFDADTLEPLGITGQTKIHEDLAGQLSAAHSSTDPKTGEIFNYNLTMGPTHTYKVWRASPNGETEVLATIKGASVQGSYIHSLSLTDNFVILAVWPAHFRAKGLAIPWERNLLDAMRFDPAAPTTWFVIDRHHGRGVVRTFTSSSFFCFHTTNSWEEKSKAREGSVDLICELVEFPNTDVLQMFYYDTMVSTAEKAATAKDRAGENIIPHLVRYKLDAVPLQGPAQPITERRSAEKIMSCVGGDLPVYNPRFTFKPHRYVYSVLDRGKSSFLDGLGKSDTQDGSMLAWEREHHTPGEPIFVMAPDGVDEDDGVLLSVVFDGDVGTSYLLCLDAKTFQEVGRAVAPVSVGFGFHGKHVPRRSL